MATTPLATVYGTSRANPGYSVSWRPFINWRVTGQNITNNTSTVTAYAGLVHISGTVRAWGNFSGTMYIDGIARNVSGFVSNSANRVTFATYTFTVPHNSNGSKSLPIRFVGSIPGTNSYVGTSLSANRTLPTIARRSIPTLNISTVTIGNTVVLTTNRHSSSFLHKLELWRSSADGGSSVRYGEIASGITNTATINTSNYASWMINRYPSATSGVFFIRCITLNGSTEIGRRDVTFTGVIPNTSEYRPNLSNISISDLSNGYSQIGSYVQNHSQLNIVPVGASGVFGSTINGYRVSIGNSSFISNTTPIIRNLNVSGTIPISVEARDTRNRYSPAVTTTISSLAYNPPSISSTARVDRANDVGNPTSLGTHALITRFSGTHSRLIVDNVDKNSRYLHARVREKNTTVWLHNIYLNPSLMVGNWTNLQQLIGQNDIAIDKVYEIQLRGWDTLTGVSGAASRILELAISSTALSIAKEGVGVGRIWEQTNGSTLQVAGNVYVDGRVIEENPSFSSGTFTATAEPSSSYQDLYSLTLELPANLQDGKDRVFTLRTSSLAWTWLGRVGSQTIVLLSIQPGSRTVTINWVGPSPS